MSATTVITLISELVANLPAAITTGQQVIHLVNSGYARLKDAIGDREATPAEINGLVAEIIANSSEIQAIA